MQKQEFEALTLFDNFVYALKTKEAISTISFPFGIRGYNSRKMFQSETFKIYRISHHYFNVSRLGRSIAQILPFHRIPINKPKEFITTKIVIVMVILAIVKIPRNGGLYVTTNVTHENR
jgi:hypothetical protein